MIEWENPLWEAGFHCSWSQGMTNVPIFVALLPLGSKDSTLPGGCFLGFL